MKDRISALVAILLLASLAAVTYWYSQTTRLGRLAAPVSREGPDFVARGVTVTQFDDNGQATNRLYTIELQHFAADDHSELVEPRLSSLRPNQPKMEARAKSARVESGGERVLMEGDVVVTRSASGKAGAGADAAPMQLRTQSLLAIPDLDRYSSDVAVEIDYGDSVVRAVGMDYDNVARVVKFRSNVRGSIAADAAVSNGVGSNAAGSIGSGDKGR